MLLSEHLPGPFKSLAQYEIVRSLPPVSSLVAPFLPWEHIPALAAMELGKKPEGDLTK